MWRVVEDFADAKDGNHVYHAGDKYPRTGMPDASRVKELSGNNNRLHKPLIAEEPAKKRKKEVLKDE